MELAPIAATTIGSFPRPTWLAQTDRSRALFRLEGAALKEAQDDATALSIHTQERIGLDLLSDGRVDFGTGEEWTAHCSIWNTSASN